MSSYGQDPSMEALLDLDGEILVLDPKGSYVVRFVSAGLKRPHFPRF
jgi:hypothetical protein